MWLTVCLGLKGHGPASVYHPTSDPWPFPGFLATSTWSRGVFGSLIPLVGVSGVGAREGISTPRGTSPPTDLPMWPGMIWEGTSLLHVPCFPCVACSNRSSFANTPGWPSCVTTAPRALGHFLKQVDGQGREGMVACLSCSLNTHEACCPAWKFCQEL